MFTNSETAMVVGKANQNKHTLDKQRGTEQQHKVESKSCLCSCTPKLWSTKEEQGKRNKKAKQIIAKTWERI